MKKKEIQKGQEEERKKEKNKSFPTTGVDFVASGNNKKRTKQFSG
jgi:hypothetical protein